MAVAPALRALGLGGLLTAVPALRGDPGLLAITVDEVAEALSTIG